MATTYTLTGKAADLVGEDFAASDLTGYVESSQDVINEADVNTQRYGRKSLSFAGDGTWSVELVGTGDLVQAYRVVIRTRDRILGVKTVESGWFELTADAEFGDVVEVERIAIETAADYAAAAAASAAEAELIAGLTGEDAAVAALIGNEDSDTYAALQSVGGGSGLPKNIVTKTSAYTAAGGDFVRANTTSAGFTVTLPTSPATGTLVAVKKVSADSNTLTIAPAGGGTIDGDATATTITENAGIVVEHVGSNVWLVAASMSTTGPAGADGTDGIDAALSTIQDEGSSLPQRAILNVTGGGVTATDVGGKTVLNIPGGAGVPHVETRTGSFYTAPAGATVSSYQPSDGYTHVVPIFFSKSVTLDRIGLGIAQAGDAGCKVRLGIYADDGSMNAGALILDAGQIAADVVAINGSAPEITISQVLSAGIYWLAAVQQGAGSMIPRAVTNSPVQIPVASKATIENASPVGFADNGGVSGALPGTFSATYNQPACPRVFVRVA